MTCPFQFGALLADDSNIAMAQLWVGTGNETSLLHMDHWDNIYTVVAGHKQLLLIDGQHGEQPQLLDVQRE